MSPYPTCEGSRPGDSRSWRSGAHAQAAARFAGSPRDQPCGKFWPMGAGDFCDTQLHGAHRHHGKVERVYYGPSRVVGVSLVEGISVDADPQTCGGHHGTVRLNAGTAAAASAGGPHSRTDGSAVPLYLACEREISCRHGSNWQARARAQLTKVHHHDHDRAQQKAACEFGRLEPTQRPEDGAGHGAEESSSTSHSRPRRHDEGDNGVSPLRAQGAVSLLRACGDVLCC